LALTELAFIKRKAGDLSGAQGDAAESQRAAKIAGNLYAEANALRVEAICWCELGSYSHCISRCDRAIHLLDLCALSGGTLHNSIQNQQAEVHRYKSEYAEARNIQASLLHIHSADKSPYYHALTLYNIAQIDVEIGGLKDDVQQKISTAALLFHRVKFSAGITLCEMLRAAVNVEDGQLLAARSCFQKCLRNTWGKDPESVMYCLEKLGAVEQWSPTDRISFLWPMTFLANSLKLKQRLQLHKALQFLGDVFWTQGDHDTASSLLTVALDGFTQMDVHRSRAECMVRLGDISKLNGDEARAVDLWQTARPLFERSSQGKQLTSLDAKLANLSHNQSQGVQEEILNHLSDIHAPTEHLEHLSGAQSPASTGIDGNVGMEDTKAAVHGCT
jgi:tetratricopeptide (TPR) repeat protein